MSLVLFFVSGDFLMIFVAGEDWCLWCFFSGSLFFLAKIGEDSLFLFF